MSKNEFFNILLRRFFPLPGHDLLIINATLLADPGLGEMRPMSWLAAAGGVISGIGGMAEAPAQTASCRIIDAAGGLLMPGLVNGHCHGAMTLFRGLADDLPLMRWLTEYIFPAEARLVDPEMVYWCSRLAAAEMILSGTTTVADGYFHEDAAARAFCDCGLRAVAAQGIIDFPAPGVPDPGRNIAAAADFLAAWQGKNPLVTPAVFCHSPYTCSPDTLRRAKALARESGCLFFIHLAETKEEVAQIMAKHGQSPAGLLDSLGLLDESTVCVHGNWLDAEDIRLLAASGAGVVTCPESNMKLAAGTASLDDLLAAGVPVSLGTDGCASNNDLDLFQEMGACSRLHKVASHDPTVLPARTLLEMATGGGAKVLGLAGEIGCLAPGMRADCLIVNLRRPGLIPFHSPATLVYAGRGSDVSTVIIDGRVIMEERRIQAFDLDETLARVRHLASKLKQSASRAPRPV